METVAEWFQESGVSFQEWKRTAGTEATEGTKNTRSSDT